MVHIDIEAESTDALIAAVEPEENQAPQADEVFVWDAERQRKYLRSGQHGTQDHIEWSLRHMDEHANFKKSPDINLVHQGIESMSSVLRSEVHQIVSGLNGHREKRQELSHHLSQISHAMQQGVHWYLKPSPTGNVYTRQIYAHESQYTAEHGQRLFDDSGVIRNIQTAIEMLGEFDPQVIEERWQELHKIEIAIKRQRASCPMSLDVVRREQELRKLKSDIPWVEVNAGFSELSLQDVLDELPPNHLVDQIIAITVDALRDAYLLRRPNGDHVAQDIVQLTDAIAIRIRSHAPSPVQGIAHGMSKVTD